MLKNGRSTHQAGHHGNGPRKYVGLIGAAPLYVVRLPTFVARALWALPARMVRRFSHTVRAHLLYMSCGFPPLPGSSTPRPPPPAALAGGRGRGESRAAQEGRKRGIPYIYMCSKWGKWRIIRAGSAQRPLATNARRWAIYVHRSWPI